MNISFTGKNVLVTGAATGIGRAIAVSFKNAGAQVFVNHLDQETLAAEIIENGEAMATYSADVSQKGAVTRMITAIESQYGPIDILVNNAGISEPKPFLEITEQDWDKTLTVNLKGAMLCSQAVIPAMQRKGEGVIINIVSELGFLGREEFAAYTASKGGLVSLTRSLAREFAPVIRVNGVAPGPVMTDLLRSELKSEDDLKKEMDIPVKRIGEAEEIASSVVFLASDHARFYCGEILSPNGGALMR